MDQNIVWTYEQRCKQVVKSLQKNGFEAIYCENKEAARRNIIDEASNADTIGFGGSMTVQELGMGHELATMGKRLLQHNQPGLTREESMAIRRLQLSCDLFLTSTNAITLSGQLVNVDGVGNRVGAMVFGPKKVIVAAGRNKIVDDLDCALKRIKNIATPANARRLNLKLPCGVTGYCNDCNTPDCICRVTVIIDKKPSLSDIRVLIINDDLGY